MSVLLRIFFGKEREFTNKEKKTGSNGSARPFPRCRIPRPAFDQTLRFSTCPASDDGSLESRLLDTGVDEWQGLVLCDKSPYRCPGRWIYPRDDPLRDVFL